MGRTNNCGYRYNLIPFHEIRRFIKYANIIGWKSVAINIFGNVIAFMPFGYLIPIIIKQKTGIIKTTLLSMIFSVGVETIQLFFKIGSFDVDDIFLNTLGGLTGYILFYLIYGRRQNNARKKA